MRHDSEMRGIPAKAAASGLSWKAPNRFQYGDSVFDILST
jgi:hypothetical protein